MRFVTFSVFALAALTLGAEPRDDDYTMSTQARWAITATWIGLLIGFVGTVMTIRRDRAAALRNVRNVQKMEEERIREIVHEILNDPKYRERLDQRVKEVGRSMAYEEFRFDPRADDRMRLVEEELRELRSRVNAYRAQSNSGG